MRAVSPRVTCEVMVRTPAGAVGGVVALDAAECDETLSADTPAGVSGAPSEIVCTESTGAGNEYEPVPPPVVAEAGGCCHAAIADAPGRETSSCGIGGIGCIGCIGGGGCALCDCGGGACCELAEEGWASPPS